MLKAFFTVLPCDRRAWSSLSEITGSDFRRLSRFLQTQGRPRVRGHKVYLPKKEESPSATSESRMTKVRPPLVFRDKNHYNTASFNCDFVNCGQNHHKGHNCNQLDITFLPRNSSSALAQDLVWSPVKQNPVDSSFPNLSPSWLALSLLSQVLSTLTR